MSLVSPVGLNLTLFFVSAISYPIFPITYGVTGDEFGNSYLARAYIGVVAITVFSYL